MKRTYANLLIAVALLTGVGFATAALLQSNSSTLPALPTTTQTNPQANSSSEENGVVDLNDWQRTRVILGKASNPIPK